MDIDRHGLDGTQAENPTEIRIKSPGRMAVEAEINFLKNQNGDLEVIREKLGLSRRKIAQLLLVDPSAWTRWTASGGEAPPLVYRALDWYLAGMEKDPEYRRLAKRFSDWLSHEKDHEGRLLSLEALLEGRKKEEKWRDFVAPLATFVAGLLLSYFLLRA